MSMVDEISAFLEVTGHGTLATDIFRRNLPDDPDDVTCVIQLQGDAPDWVHDGADIEIENPTLQILARSINPRTAEMRLLGPYRELRTIRNQMIGGTRYITITPMATPELADRDDNGRFIARCDFQVRKELSSDT